MTFATNAERSELPPRLTLRAATFLTRLASDRTFLAARVLPLLGEAAGSESWYVAHRHDTPDGVSFQIFVWPPGSSTRIHDHSSWGAFCCAAGAVLEERYERLDDGSRPEYARLRVLWRRVWGRRDGVSTVLPYERGIHRVGNAGGRAAVSIHLYGPRAGDVDGRDYDPARDYVCDRR
ncbi:hypothetical protein E0L93_09760 [Rubrobacter taiwanensis]|jgi:hypothetical protein|uniref:Cysteine dioxygenase n=1 Tax=Rubrobacter taiwanensis TaxID=185139 RepID=A0A4R1BGS4_9ACTN|nr:cysteine dioxygenase family protein [Rubrobacter taiwanensis]TCJ16403.1 hypothetical protein E0L93_09760 [Rubrobacter taiwanensis]